MKEFSQKIRKRDHDICDVWSIADAHAEIKILKTKEVDS